MKNTTLFWQHPAQYTLCLLLQHSLLFSRSSLTCVVAVGITPHWMVMPCQAKWLIGVLTNDSVACRPLCESTAQTFFCVASAAAFGAIRETLFLVTDVRIWCMEPWSRIDTTITVEGALTQACWKQLFVSRVRVVLGNRPATGKLSTPKFSKTILIVKHKLRAHLPENINCLRPCSQICRGR